MVLRAGEIAMQRTLRKNSRITDDLHAEVASEIHSFFGGNIETFRKELLEDATNTKFTDSVDNVDTLLGLGNDSDEDYVEDLERFRDFSSKWVRKALIPTVIDHLNDVFCRNGSKEFRRRGRSDWIYFGEKPDTLFWTVRAKENPAPEYRFPRYPDALRDLLPEIFPEKN